MTCHVAYACDRGAIILADTQMSGSDREYHGAQKIVTGRGFVLGGAGHGGVLGELYRFVNTEGGKWDSRIEGSKSVPSKICAWLEKNIRPSAVQQVALILARHTQHGPRIQRYLPQYQTGFGLPVMGGPMAIGSGEEFVARADARDRSLRIIRPKGTFVDLVYSACCWAGAGSTSTTR